MVNSGFVDVRPLETSSGEVARESLSNTFPPLTTEGMFNNLQVGVGNYVFHVSEEGMWLGAEKFEDAPFKVSMDGTTTIGGGSIAGALYVGEAAEDINTHTTTISGNRITTGTITADQIGVGAIVASKIASGTITSEKIGAGQILAVNIAAGTIAATHIATGTITGTQLADGSVSDVKIANATISGGKIQNGTITGTNIAGGTITGTNIAGGTITGANIAGGTISGANIVNATITNTHIANVSADKLTAGTIYVGYSGRPGTIVLNRNGTDGFLTWTGGNKIWSDGSQYMGLMANGERFYFYTGGVIYALFQRYQQASFYTGISASGARSYIYGGLTVSDTGATINGGTVVNNGLTLSGTSSMNCHINSSAGTYNLGGSSSYWNYVNARGFTTHSLTSFDSPVLMPEGEILDDISALKAIKERIDIVDSKTGRVLLDKRSFPVDVVIKAADENGVEYERDENNDPLVPDESGKIESRPDADAVDLVQFTSLLFGGFKQLVKRVEELEKKLN